MTDLLALIAIIVSVVMGGGAIWVAVHLDRKRNPKREFTHTVETTPLVNPRAKGLDKLAVLYDGDEVVRPYLVTVKISSTGRADIPSSSFDGGKPVTIDLQVPILAEIDQRANVETVDAHLQLTGDATIELPPSLLPKGYTLRATYICEGKPTPKLKIHLPDITVRSVDLAPVTNYVFKATRTVLVLLMVGTAAVAVAVLATSVRH